MPFTSIAATGYPLTGFGTVRATIHAPRRCNDAPVPA